MNLTRRQWALIALVTLLWGLNWPMMKFALREVSPLYFRAITMSGGQALRLLWLALPNIIGWRLCSIIGLSQLPTGRPVIPAFTMPVWTVLLTLLLAPIIAVAIFSATGAAPRPARSDNSVR